MNATIQENIVKANADPLKPKFHFSAPLHWMNDPNGTIYYKGQYHLFYQFNPDKPQWGNIHWGQAVSTDLIHWEHLPIALYPDKQHGEKHCFSGCCVIKENQPQLFYTSIGGKLGLLNVIRGAAHWRVIGDEGFADWKRPDDPVFVSQKLHDRKIYQWRDPYLWFENDHWELVIVGKYFGEKFGSVFRYVSDDLDAWQFKGRWIKGDPTLGKAWECPNVLSFDDHKVVIISPFGQVIYTIGGPDAEKFTPADWQRLDHGKDFYATNTYQTPSGIVLVGWVKCRGDDWAGCLGLPRQIWLAEDGSLRQKPVSQTALLRKKQIEFPEDGEETIHGYQLEILACFEPPVNQKIGFQISCGEEVFFIGIDPKTNIFTCLNESMPLQHIQENQPFSLQIFIDHCLVEVFINQREVFTAWARPASQETPWKIKVLPESRENLSMLEIWELDDAGVNDLGCWLKKNG